MRGAAAAASRVRALATVGRVAGGVAAFGAGLCFAAARPRVFGLAAAADGGGMELLAVVNRDAHTGPLTLADGRRCATGALPYAVD